MRISHSRFTVHGLRFTPWATAVLLLAAVFRLVWLVDVPPGLAQDEVLDADIAALIRSGQHAFFFREGYGHEPLYHYLAAPFAPLLGDNVLAIRLPSVILGLLLVALALRWAKREFGGVTAVAAGLGLAISWWPIIFSRIGIRPILLPVLLLLAVWFWRRPWLAGLFLGLGFYSYTAARIIFLLPVGFALAQWLAGRRTLGDVAWWRWLAITLGVFMLVAAPMQITLWRDPSLQQRVDQLSGPLDALRQGDVGPIWETTRATLGVFSFTGDPRWTYSLPDRPLFDGATAVFFYLGLALALWRWRDGRMALLLVWLAVGLIPSAVTPQAPSTVRLVGAMPVVYLLGAVGIAEIWQRLAIRDWGLAGGDLLKNSRYSPFIRVLFLALLVMLVIGNGGRTVADGFVKWSQAQETRLNHYQAVLLAMARHYEAAPVDRLVVAEAFYEPIDGDSFRRMLGYDPAARWVQTGAGVAGAVVLPAGTGNGRFYVPEFAPVPADLLQWAGIAARPLFRSQTTPSFAVYGLPGQPAAPAQVTNLSFEGQIRLTGYEIMIEEGGRPLRLFSSWEVLLPLPADLATFVHLVDQQGEIVSQHDGLDAAASTLQPGDVIVQRHLLEVTAVSPGTYYLQMGLYRRGDGLRLTVGPMREDIVRLPQAIRIDGN